MKKIQYKVLKTLLLAALVSGLTSIALADPPAGDAKKTHEKTATTTHTDTHTATASTTHTAEAKDRPKTGDPKTGQHDDHVTHDTQHPDDHARDNGHPDDHFVHDGGGHRDAHYAHDSRGWYDEDHHRHDFIVYRGHRGYWNYEDGRAVFVAIDIGLPFSINIHL